MIKLKEILNEKKQLNEKKELDARTIQAVAKMTDSNAHTHARIELTQALRNKKLEKAYRGINDIVSALGFDGETKKLRGR